MAEFCDTMSVLFGFHGPVQPGLAQGKTGIRVGVSGVDLVMGMERIAVAVM